MWRSGGKAVVEACRHRGSGVPSQDRTRQHRPAGAPALHTRDQTPSVAIVTCRQRPDRRYQPHDRHRLRGATAELHPWSFSCARCGRTGDAACERLMRVSALRRTHGPGDGLIPIRFSY